MKGNTSCWIRAQQLPGGAQVVGGAHVGRHEGEHLLLDQVQVPLPVPGGDAVFQLGQQLAQLIPPAGGHGVRHPGQVAQQVALDVGGGGKVAVAFQEIQDVPPDPGGIRPGVGVPKQGKQGPAETGPCLHLRAEKLEELPLVHLQQAHDLGHLLGDALAHAGGDHRPLPGQELGQHLHPVLPLAELLDKGLVIGVVPDLLPRLSGVLLFGAVVRPGHPVQVWDVLDLVIIGRNRNVSVDVCIVITRHRVGRA